MRYPLHDISSTPILQPVATYVGIHDCTQKALRCYHHGASSHVAGIRRANAELGADGFVAKTRYGHEADRTHLHDGLIKGGSGVAVS